MGSNSKSTRHKPQVLAQTSSIIRRVNEQMNTYLETVTYIIRHPDIQSQTLSMALESRKILSNTLQPKGLNHK